MKLKTVNACAGQQVPYSNRQLIQCSNLKDIIIIIIVIHNLPLFLSFSFLLCMTKRTRITPVRISINKPAAAEVLAIVIVCLLSAVCE